MLNLLLVKTVQMEVETFLHTFAISHHSRLFEFFVVFVHILSNEKKCQIAWLRYI